MTVEYAMPRAKRYCKQHAEMDLTVPVPSGPWVMGRVRSAWQHVNNAIVAKFAAYQCTLWYEATLAQVLTFFSSSLKRGYLDRCGERNETQPFR